MPHFHHHVFLSLSYMVIHRFLVHLLFKETGIDSHILFLIFDRVNKTLPDLVSSAILAIIARPVYPSCLFFSPLLLKKVTCISHLVFRAMTVKTFINRL